MLCLTVKPFQNLNLGKLPPGVTLDGLLTEVKQRSRGVFVLRGVLPYMAYTGMCRWVGHGFHSSLS